MKRFVRFALISVVALARTAEAVEFLFVGMYYERGSQETCAEGRYMVRDAANKEALKAIRDEFLSNKEYQEKRTATYSRGTVAAIYNYRTKDVYYIGPGNRTYTTYNSLSAPSTTEAEKKVKQRAIEYKSSFLFEPAIIFTGTARMLISRAKYARAGRLAP